MYRKKYYENTRTFTNETDARDGVLMTKTTVKMNSQLVLKVTPTLTVVQIILKYTLIGLKLMHV